MQDEWEFQCKRIKVKRYQRIQYFQLWNLAPSQISKLRHKKNLLVPPFADMIADMIATDSLSPVS